MPTNTKTPQTMSELVDQMGDALVPFAQGDLVEVSVISVSKDKITVDVAGLATGIIPEKEFSADSADIKVGDKTQAYILSTQNEKGYIILSLKKAEKEKIWSLLEQRNNQSEIIAVKIIGANRGGLVAEYGNMQGFIPVSQLSVKHYPRVDGDKHKIQQRLSELIGKSITVKIISYDKKAGKIIFSEKAAGDTDLEERAKTFEVGQKVKGKITGIVDFGLFVDIGELEGLIHISQVSWQRIDSLRNHFKVAQEIEAEVINVEGGRVSLSIKKLLADPWQTEVKDLSVGDKIKGEVTKVTPYGAFVKLSENLEGLVHVSQLQKEEGEANEKEALKENTNYDFEIISIEPELRKISLKPA